MGGSRVEEEVRGTVVCWDMIVWVSWGLFFFGVGWGWKEGGRWWKWDRLREKRERERFVTMLFCHLDYLYLL